MKILIISGICIHSEWSRKDWTLMFSCLWFLHHSGSHWSISPNTNDSPCKTLHHITYQHHCVYHWNHSDNCQLQKSINSLIFAKQFWTRFPSLKFKMTWTAEHKWHQTHLMITQHQRHLTDQIAKVVHLSDRKWYQRRLTYHTLPCLIWKA